jgi:hypothetical protein
LEGIKNNGMTGEKRTALSGRPKFAAREKAAEGRCTPGHWRESLGGRFFPGFWIHRALGILRFFDGRVCIEMGGNSEKLIHRAGETFCRYGWRPEPMKILSDLCCKNAIKYYIKGV